MKSYYMYLPRTGGTKPQTIEISDIKVYENLEKARIASTVITKQNNVIRAPMIIEIKLEGEFKVKDKKTGEMNIPKKIREQTISLENSRAFSPQGLAEISFLAEKPSISTISPDADSKVPNRFDKKI